MKKLLFLTFIMLLVACGSLPTTSRTIEPKITDRTIDGEWTLESVTHNPRGGFDIILLNDTAKECFEGSTWHFVPTNNRGTYRINHQDCATGERNFVFVIQQKDKSTGYYDFLLKPTNEKYQTETNQGILLRLSHLSTRTMIWEQTVQVDGKPFIITMNFVK